MKLMTDDVDSMKGSESDGSCSKKSLEDVDRKSQVNDTASDSENLRSGVFGLILDLMTVRSSLVLLSEPSTLAGFMRKDLNRQIFSKLLSLAWPERNGDQGNSEFVRAVRTDPLSTVPTHEARLGHLFALLKDLTLRMEILQQTPEIEWAIRLEKTKSQKDVGRSGTSRPEPSKTVTSPPDTPPPTLVSVRSRRGIIASHRDTDAQSNRSISQSTGGSNSEDEDDQSESAATAAAHLREAAIAQMAELGIPRSYSELALRRTGGTNIEAAVHFCLENGSEIERMLAEEMERQAPARALSRGRTNSEDGHLLRQLLEMGFPRRWRTEALAATGNNVDDALTF